MQEIESMGLTFMKISCTYAISLYHDYVTKYQSVFLIIRYIIYKKKT